MQQVQTERFRLFLEGYVDFLEEMAASESDKYAAIISYNAKRLDQVVAMQQAQNMRLTQLEEQREAQQEAAGLGGLTFAEILEKLPPTERPALQEMFRRFEAAIEQIKFYNAKSVAFAEEGMRLLGLQKQPEAPYAPDGKKRQEGTSLFETQI